MDRNRRAGIGAHSEFKGSGSIGISLPALCNFIAKFDSNHKFKNSDNSASAGAAKCDVIGACGKDFYQFAAGGHRFGRARIDSGIQSTRRQNLYQAGYTQRKVREKAMVSGNSHW